MPDWKARPKTEAALALLDFLADADPVFASHRLVRRIEETVVRVRGAIEAGDLQAVAGRLTKAGRTALQEQLDGLAADRLRQVYGRVTPSEVRPVLVDAPRDPDRHAVVALVTIKSRDYRTNARTGDVRDGTPDEWVVTQEFWTFRRAGDKWRLDRIRPAAEADELLNVLNELSAERYRPFEKSAPRAILAHVAALAG